MSIASIEQIAKTAGIRGGMQNGDAAHFHSPNLAGLPPNICPVLNWGRESGLLLFPCADTNFSSKMNLAPQWPRPL